jgi:hypothetical protein
VVDGIKMPADEFHPIGVAYRQHGGGQFLRSEIEVIDCPTFIDNKLTFRDWLHKMPIFFSTFVKIILISHLPKKLRPLAGPLLTVAADDAGCSRYLRLQGSHWSRCLRPPENQIGLVAEWLGRALQKLLQQFESARDLKQYLPKNRPLGGFFFE